MPWREVHRPRPRGERLLGLITTLAIIVSTLIILLAIACEVLPQMGIEVSR